MTYKLTKEQRREIVQMYEAGHKCEYIGALFGVRREYASKLSIRRGSAPRKEGAKLPKPMDRRSCAECDAAFDTRHGHKMTCSDACKTQRGRRRRRSRLPRREGAAT